MDNNFHASISDLSVCVLLGCLVINFSLFQQTTEWLRILHVLHK